MRMKKLHPIPNHLPCIFQATFARRNSNHSHNYDSLKEHNPPIYWLPERIGACFLKHLKPKKEGPYIDPKDYRRYTTYDNHTRRFIERFGAIYLKEYMGGKI